MAYSYVNYTGDGSQVNFSVPYSYLLKAHVKVYVQGLLKTVDIHYTWLNDAVIQFGTAPLEDEIVSIKRDSGRDARLVDFVTGTLLKEEYLDLDSNQLFYLMQEAFDALTAASGEDSGVYSTPEAIIDAFTGSISLDQLDPTVGAAVGYLNTNYLNDAIYEFDEDGSVVYEDEIYHHGYTKLVWIDGNLLVTGSVTATKIAADQIEATHMAVDSILSASIKSGEIEATHMAADSILAASIKAGEIDTGHLAADCITANEIDADAVLAASIKAGELTASHIKGTDFGTLTITSGAIDINVASGLEIQAGAGMSVIGGADITLVGSDTDPGKLIFDGTSYTVEMGLDAAGDNFTLTPNTDDVTSLYFGAIDWWQTDKYWDEIVSSAKGMIKALSYYDGTNFCSSQVTAAQTYQNVFMGTKYDNTSASVRLYHSATIVEFASLQHKAIDLGASDRAWDDVYADDYNNVADFYFVDTKDDLAVLNAIKGSGVIEERTGLELIDDLTLPEWMLVKDKRTGEILYSDEEQLKPYVSNRTFFSLLMGAIREEDSKVEELIQRIEKLERRE